MTIWTYFTPIFYDLSILPVKLQALFKLNPLYQFINFVRTIVLYNQLPSFGNFLGCIFYGVFIFLIGCIVFKKNQDKFIYYI